MDRLLKIQGAIVGGAIGDAVGFLVEKSPISEVNKFASSFQQENFIVKNRTYPRTYNFGQYSDDTQFSKLLMESYLINRPFKELLVRDYQSKKLVGLGKNTKRLLTAFSKNLPVDPEWVKNISNGSVMRSWPIGILFSNPLEIKSHNLQHCQLTHNTPEAIESSEFIAQVMNLVLNNKKVQESDLVALAPLTVKTLLEKGLQASTVENLRQLLLYPALPDWEGIPPFAVQTAVAAIVAFFKTINEDFKSSLTFGLNLGGDTDSVCSVIGALKGCHAGIDSINPFLRNMVQDEGEFKEDFLLSMANEVNSL